MLVCKVTSTESGVMVSEIEQIVAMRKALQTRYGKRSAIIESTLILMRRRNEPWHAVIDECQRMTRLFVDRTSVNDIEQIVCEIVGVEECQ